MRCAGLGLLLLLLLLFLLCVARSLSGPVEMYSPTNGSTVYNMTMMSPLSYTALLIKEHGSDKYDKAIICSFHTTKGIVARVNFPEPIVVHQFVDTTEPEGHTGTTYTQCSTKVSMPQPTKAKYKLISGRWESELVLDEHLGIDVAPAAADAKVMSNSKRIHIPSANVPAVRSHSHEEHVDDLKESEKSAPKRHYEKQRSSKRIASEEEETKSKKKKVMHEREHEEHEDEDTREEHSEEHDYKGRSKSKKEEKVKRVKSTKDSKRGKKEKDYEESEEEEVVEKEIAKKKKKSKDSEDHHEEETRSKDHGEKGSREGSNEDYEDPDTASGLCVLTSIVLSTLFAYSL